MSLGQDFFIGAVEAIWKFARERGVRKKVAHMTSEELSQWRSSQFAKIHDEATRLATFASDRDLDGWGFDRATLVRRYEVLLRNDLGVKMNQNLLDGMDIRALDLRRVRGLSQGQIDLAQGDSGTQLPSYLKVPESWV